MANLFERLSKGRPSSTEKTQKPPPEQLLLNWLQRWPKPTVSTKDIRVYGPYSLRNGESAIRSAQILAAHGFLSPVTARRWQIIRQTLTPIQ